MAIFGGKKVKTVSEVVSSLATIVNDLQAITDAKVAEVNDIDKQMADLLVKKNDAVTEQARAEQVRKNIDALINPPVVTATIPAADYVAAAEREHGTANN